MSVSVLPHIQYLLDILHLHELPAQMKINSESRSSTKLSTTALAKIKCPVSFSFVEDLCPRDLQHLLERFAHRLHRAHLDPSHAKPGEERDLLSRRIRHAVDLAYEKSRQPQDGEAALQSIVSTSVTDPINHLLLRTPFDSGRYQIFWRISSTGQGGVPDLELILVLADGSLKKLAVLEVKTMRAFESRLMGRLESAVESGVWLDKDGKARRDTNVGGGRVEMKTMQLLEQVRVV